MTESSKKRRAGGAQVFAAGLVDGRAEGLVPDQSVRQDLFLRWGSARHRPIDLDGVE